MPAASKLPPNLLRMVEEHPCFSGVWSSDCSAQCVTDPQQPARAIEVVHCSDCLSFHVAVDAQHLGPGVRRWDLADHLTAHVRSHRGYAMSVGGYHVAGSGFWLSAAYWAQIGVFVLNARNSKTPLTALLEAMKHGVVLASDPRMTQPTAYSLHEVYLDVVTPVVASSVQGLLQSPNVSPTRRPGFVPVTLAALQPAAGAVVPGQVSPAPARASRPGPRPSLGDRCVVCGQKVEERPLFQGTFIGCGCG